MARHGAGLNTFIALSLKGLKGSVISTCKVCEIWQFLRTIRNDRRKLARNWNITIGLLARTFGYDWIVTEFEMETSLRTWFVCVCVCVVPFSPI
jgi:hypothetical protein